MRSNLAAGTTQYNTAFAHLSVFPALPFPGLGEMGRDPAKPPSGAKCSRRGKLSRSDEAFHLLTPPSAARPCVPLRRPRQAKLPTVRSREGYTNSTAYDMLCCLGPVAAACTVPRDCLGTSQLYIRIRPTVHRHACVQPRSIHCPAERELSQEAAVLHIHPCASAFSSRPWHRTTTAPAPVPPAANGPIS